MVAGARPPSLQPTKRPGIPAANTKAGTTDDWEAFLTPAQNEKAPPVRTTAGLFHLIAIVLMAAFARPVCARG
jgi:hypothetical protein